MENIVATAPGRPIRVSNKWAAHALTFLMLFGPGLIVMEADNGAGAVSTYVQAGAQYGTHLLWLLLLLLPICYFVQEMVVRLGLLRGKATEFDELTLEQKTYFAVAHPLDDAHEERVDTEHLGPMQMTRTVRFCLLALRGYLLLMVGLLGFRVLQLAGVIHS